MYITIYPMQLFIFYRHRSCTELIVSYLQRKEASLNPRQVLWGSTPSLQTTNTNNYYVQTITKNFLLTSAHFNKIIKVLMYKNKWHVYSQWLFLSFTEFRKLHSQELLIFRQIFFMFLFIHKCLKRKSYLSPKVLILC